MKLIVHTDGGARGNPGSAAIGVVIEKEHDGKTTLVAEFAKRIGETTNNVAEYTGVIEALKTIASLFREGSIKDVDIEFYLDSTLVVEQLNGRFKVKDAKLRILLMEVRGLEQQVPASVEYFSVRREKNTRADYLLNIALDTS